MYLQHLILSNFKNIEAADLLFSPGINAFCGNNGSGKTNLLDAVYYLSMCKSFINQTDKDSIRFTQPEAALFGNYAFSDGRFEQIACRLTAGGEKTIKRNGKNYERIAQHIGLIPLVMVAPSDIALIQESGAQRRRFLNFLLSQAKTPYLQAVQQYERLLLQRNKYLKEPNTDFHVFQALDRSLCEKAVYIHQSRRELCELLRPLIKKFYALLSQNGEEADLQYQSDLNSETPENLLLQYAQRDRQFQYTTTGIQRDDLLFTLDSHRLKFTGSQGQQKSFLLALKLAQFALLKQLKQLAPILLLDDVFDKLDHNRVSNLLRVVVSEGFGQIFVTDSNKARVKTLIDALAEDAVCYNVENGEFTKQ